MIINNVETRPEAGVGSLFTCLFKKIKPQIEAAKPAVQNSPEKSKPKKRKLFPSTKNSLLPSTAENTPPPAKRNNNARKKRKALIEDGGNAD